MRNLAAFLFLDLLLGVLIGGCASGPRFPAPVAVDDHLGYDLDGDRRLEYLQRRDAAGRTTAVTRADLGAQEVVLDAVAAHDVPHALIVLDGVPFEVVEALYQAGQFRLFHPPRRVISCFPAMTDLALADLFQAPPCRGYEALYFDRARNALSDGSAVYLSGANAPWVGAVDYRASTWWDTLVYLNPQLVFEHELQAIDDLLRDPPREQVCVYSVGSAGLGTRGGVEAIRAYLRQIDALCERLVYEHAGRIKITITADHGHNLVENRRVDFGATLEAAGYHPARRLQDPRDVVPIAYGLVTYAAFHTADPAGVAACLAQHPDVEFACYRDGDRVVVCNAAGSAVIRRTGAGFTYEPVGADPLQLGPILADLAGAGAVAADGTIAETRLFEATSTHTYPDPLARLWRAFDGLVENPADVLANLRDGVCHGSGFFHGMLGRVSSTHGSLNRVNSTTFVLTMLGELPPVLRSRELLPELAALRAAPAQVAQITRGGYSTPTRSGSRN